MQGIELAMLFCHAGFSVKTILFDGAEEQISSELLKEITGHAPWSKLHKPNWVKAEIKYPVGVIFDEKIPLNPPLTNGVEEKKPEKDDNNNEIATPTARNDAIFVEYIKEHCGFIKILLNKKSALNQDSYNIKKQLILLPDNPLNLRSLFEKILSEAVALTAAKALDGGISYCFEGDFSKIDYMKDLEKAFAEAGVETNSEIATAHAEPRNDDINNGIATAPHCSAMQPPQSRSARQLPQSSIGGASEFEKEASASAFAGASDDVAKLIISNGKKEIEIVLEADETEIEPTKNRIYVSKHKNGLLLIDSIETRLLPDFSCQSCFSRLVSYLKTELTRLDY